MELLLPDGVGPFLAQLITEAAPINGHRFELAHRRLQARQCQQVGNQRLQARTVYVDDAEKAFS